MRIVKLKGGLGNQMFQYAFAKLIEKRTGDEVKIDFSAYTSLKNDIVRVPRIAKFKLSLPTADDSDLNSICKFNHKGDSLSLKYKVGIYAEKTFNRKYFFEPNRAFIDPASLTSYSYFDGYWQSYRYIDEVKSNIVEEFTPNYELSENTKKAMTQMQCENSVFIGVRKGDYTADKKSIAHYGNFDSAYYLTAMKKIAEKVENPKFYIFSNDVEWCKKNLDWGGYNIVYREPEQQTDDFEELMLMSSCKHAIIVNSTYNWWGAYLINNPDKIVCCPQKWFFDDAPIDIVPKEWIKISVL